MIVSLVDDFRTLSAQLTDLAALEAQVLCSVNAVLCQDSSAPITRRTALVRVEPPPLSPHDTPADAATLMAHASLISNSTTTLTLSLRSCCQRRLSGGAGDAPALDLPLARWSIFCLARNDLQPSPPPWARPLPTAMSPPSQLPAPVPSPPSVHDPCSSAPNVVPSTPVDTDAEAPRRTSSRLNRPRVRLSCRTSRGCCVTVVRNRSSGNPAASVQRTEQVRHLTRQCCGSGAKRQRLHFALARRLERHLVD